MNEDRLVAVVYCIGLILIAGLGWKWGLDIDIIILLEVMLTAGFLVIAMGISDSRWPE